MKPILLVPQSSPNLSFSVHKFTVPHLFNKWHYHPQVQLMHVINGKGIRFVGDSIKPFKSNDVVLVGANTPHLWKSDASNNKKSNLKTTAIVVGFDKSFLGNEFLNLTEIKMIKQLLEVCTRGIVLQGDTKKEVINILDKMIEADNTKKILLLLEALYLISRESKHYFLSSVGFSYTGSGIDTKRVNTIYEYALRNFKDKIELKKVSELIYMTPNSFCRYFKFHTQKSYSQIINEIRISNACRLLLEQNLSIKEVYLKSGYNNFTNFHKQFKRIAKKTPLEYQNYFAMNDYF